MFPTCWGLGTMEIQYQITKSDLLACAAFRSERDPEIRRGVLLRRIGYAAAFVLVSAGAWGLTSNPALI